MNERGRLRLGTLLWFALLGATIAITYHQELVADRIGDLVDEQRSLRGEAERVAANNDAMQRRLDEMTLQERIERAVVAERASSMRLDRPSPRHWAPPFAAWELETLWGLTSAQAETMSQRLARLHLALRAADHEAALSAALDDFAAALDEGFAPPLNGSQRSAIETWRRGIAAATGTSRPAPADKPPKTEGDDAGL